MNTVSMNKQQQRKRQKRKQEDIVDTEVLRRADLKWLDVSFSPNFSPGLVTPSADITAVPQGVTSVTRVGDRLRLKNMSYVYHVWESAVAYTSLYVRVLIVQWHPNIATFPSYTDFLTGAGSWNASLRMDTRSQYKVLYDTTHSMVSTTSNNYLVITGSLTFKDPVEVQYEAGATTGQNKISVHFIPSANRTTAGAGWRSMLRYYDY